MYRVQLTAAQRDELTQRTRTPELMRHIRDRLEYVRLADADWSIPRMAALFRAEEDTVRYWVKRFLALGFKALANQPHPGQTSRLTPALLTAVRARLAGQVRTWTRQQLAHWLAGAHGLRLSADHLGFLHRRAGLTCHRTERSLPHAQDPAQVAQRGVDLGAMGKEEVGYLETCHVDEAGLALTRPPTTSWGPADERLRFPYFAPQGRRLNLIGGYFTHGPQAGNSSSPGLRACPPRGIPAERTRRKTWPTAR